VSCAFFSAADFYTDNARLLADLIKIMGPTNCVFAKTKHCTTSYKGRKFRVFYQELAKLGFVELGYDTTLDITLSGTDTCNLGIAAVQVSLLNWKRVLKRNTLTAIIKESQSKLVAV
jgi:sulfite reductase (ferredoxin)